MTNAATGLSYDDVVVSKARYRAMQQVISEAAHMIMIAKTQGDVVITPLYKALKELEAVE